MTHLSTQRLVPNIDKPEFPSANSKFLPWPDRVRQVHKSVCFWHGCNIHEGPIQNALSVRKWQSMMIISAFFHPRQSSAQWWWWWERSVKWFWLLSRLWSQITAPAPYLWARLELSRVFTSGLAVNIIPISEMEPLFDYIQVNSEAKNTNEPQ